MGEGAFEDERLEAPKDVFSGVKASEKGEERPQIWNIPR